ncbi:DUF4304 domain-containing protein [Tamlana sp. I1]|uniref:DUF4304 domain-containing protein n=1 Tax=Tamlana sp. I1 TaxID=2762061 RepID=UPI00189022F5|nr:DUF4304 domain-containing protein [Tamlana sp. I1]
MTAKELKTFLSNAFKEKLSPLGFKKIRDNYVLTEGDRTYSLTFNSLNYDNSYRTSFSAFTGYIIVNKILQRALGEDEQKVNKTKIGDQIYLTQVILWEQGNYLCKDYDIYTLKEAKKAVDEIVEHFTDNILPEFKKINSLFDFDQLFNLGDYIKNSKRLKLDIMCALVIAKLVSNPNYNSLSKNYQKRIDHFSEWDKKEVNNLIQYLESNSGKFENHPA